ncbi:hypothetical protein GCM10023224_45020 [Streptomonospora halophila]|uniref:Uncharacterized protein n=1 Tax=Streptomonospora halophila TaxID=427369 RepID=A0ABP9GVG4_9ACTN
MQQAAGAHEFRIGGLGAAGQQLLGNARDDGAVRVHKVEGLACRGVLRVQIADLSVAGYTHALDPSDPS